MQKSAPIGLLTLFSRACARLAAAGRPTLPYACTTVRIPEGRLQRLVATSDGGSASTVPVQSTEALRRLLPTRSGGDIRLLISTSRAQFECVNTALLCWPREVDYSAIHMLIP